MNRTLLDPFQTVQLPEVIEEYLEQGRTRCIALNSRGTLCAAGCEDGEVIIWDMETRGVARTYKAHSGAVTCLAWSRDGLLLLSGSADGHVVWWDMGSNREAHRAELGRPVSRLCIMRRQPLCALVSFSQGAPALVTVAAAEKPEVKQVPTLVIEGEGKGGSANLNYSGVVALAVFSQGGEHLYIGQTRGTLLVLERHTFDILDIIRISGAPRINHMLLNRKGTHLLVNCNDRGIRLFETRCYAGTKRNLFTLSEIKSKVAVMKLPKHGSLLYPHEPLLIKVREFNNAVERMNWKAVAFSSDSEYVVAAPDTKAEHSMYIWSRVWGKLERILEGPKEGVLDIAAHPLHSILLSVSTAGRIFIWSTVYRENWSAFAPDFEELEENQEYIEREDEFDLNPRPQEDAAPSKSKGGDGEEEGEEDVDVVAVDQIAVLSSDEEGDTGGLYHLPVDIVPEQEDAGAQEEDAGGAANGTAGNGVAARRQIHDAHMSDGPAGSTRESDGSAGAAVKKQRM